MSATVSTPPFLLLVASLMVLIASATICANISKGGSFYAVNFGTDANGNVYSGCNGDLGWAVACPAVTLALVLVFFLLQWLATGIAVKIECWLAVFLAIFWIPGAFVMTFRGPFLATGNGYFGAWGSLVAAVLWAVNAGVYDALKGIRISLVKSSAGSGDAKIAAKGEADKTPV